MVLSIKRSSFEIESFTISELADLRFPFIPIKNRVTEINKNSPLYPALVARDETVVKRTKPISQYLSILQNAFHSCPNEDLAYVWLSEIHLIEGNFEEAKNWAIEGLSNAYDSSRLAYMLASAYLRLSKPIAIGWFVQSCLLGSLEFTPYLFSAKAAEVIGLQRLYWRLLNASDALSPGKRVPDAERNITQLAMKLDRAELDNALNRFEYLMNNYLPPADVFPNDASERDIFIWAHYDDIVREVCKGLLARYNW